jgi:pimeloyl-ACP methyl ester carboxylesterase
MLCTGEQDGPVVVLDAGLGDSSLVWASVQEQLAPHVRVCSYDRAGIAWSDPATTSRTEQSAAEELYALLQNAGEPPPYILVGHLAGVNAACFDNRCMSAHANFSPLTSRQFASSVALSSTASRPH